MTVFVLEDLITEEEGREHKLRCLYTDCLNIILDLVSFCS